MSVRYEGGSSYMISQNEISRKSKKNNSQKSNAVSSSQEPSLISPRSSKRNFSEKSS
jgi:hypothetical protein